MRGGTFIVLRNAQRATTPSRCKDGILNERRDKEMNNHKLFSMVKEASGVMRTQRILMEMGLLEVKG